MTRKIPQFEGSEEVAEDPRYIFLEESEEGLKFSKIAITSP
jgi:hypothetical protein